MKSYLLLTGLLVAGAPVLGQDVHLSGRVLDKKGEDCFPGVTLILQRGDSVIAGTSAGPNGVFNISTLHPGAYDLVLKMVGYRTEKKAVVLVAGQPNELTLSYPGPCQYSYSSNQLPTCVNGHTDGLIPIVYGLPRQQTMQRAKAGKIHLGGCKVTDCDPRYYCPVHQREL